MSGNHHVSSLHFLIQCTPQWQGKEVRMSSFAADFM
jgi:hypothetical protein